MAIDHFKLFRRSYSLFVKKKVLPYLVLPGPVEIDETKIGRKRWLYYGHFPKVRWAFGMYCRTTKIPIIFHIKNKKHTKLSGIIKKHVEKGSTIFSDEHPSYVILRSAKSKLAYHGFFHFWTNHSERYVHEKFTFNSSIRIESIWGCLKHHFFSLRYNSNPKNITEYLNAFMLHTMIKKSKIYSYTLHKVREYYQHYVNKWINVQKDGDLYMPPIEKIYDALKMIKN